MIKFIFAYIIAFFLAPMIGSIVGIMFLFLLPLISKIGIPIPFFRGAISVVIGFVSVLFATMVFSWFGIQPTLLMVIILGVGFCLNDFRRISHASETIKSNEIAGAVGDLLGIVLGGIYFL